LIFDKQNYNRGQPCRKRKEEDTANASKKVKVDLPKELADKIPKDDVISNIECDNDLYKFDLTYKSSDHSNLTCRFVAFNPDRKNKNLKLNEFTKLLYGWVIIPDVSDKLDRCSPEKQYYLAITAFASHWKDYYTENYSSESDSEEYQ
jgi:hypothetical protein